MIAGTNAYLGGVAYKLLIFLAANEDSGDYVPVSKIVALKVHPCYVLFVLCKQVSALF